MEEVTASGDSQGRLLGGGKVFVFVFVFAKSETTLFELAQEEDVFRRHLGKNNHTLKQAVGNSAFCLL